MADKVLMKGNEAIAEAAIRAGCRHYFGYPITPQTEIAAYMAKRLPKIGGVFLQAESEVAAINMVYGVAATGTRVMTSSSSPGISLKSEGISYMAGCDLPCVIVNVQRGGPGLGGIQPFTLLIDTPETDSQQLVVVQRAVQVVGVLVHVAETLRDQPPAKGAQRGKIHAAFIPAQVAKAQVADVARFAEIHRKGEGVMGKDMYRAALRRRYDNGAFACIRVTAGGHLRPEIVKIGGVMLQDIVHLLLDHRFHLPKIKVHSQLPFPKDIYSAGLAGMSASAMRVRPTFSLRSE